MSFLWTLNNADGTQATEKLGNVELPRLIIPRRTLSGGKIYKARVDVSMVTDSSLTTSDEVTIQVIESKLVAKIRGRQTVGSTGILKLNFSKTESMHRSECSAKELVNFREGKIS